MHLVAEGGQAGDASAQDEGVDVVGALVRVHRLQVHHVSGQDQHVIQVNIFMTDLTSWSWSWQYSFQKEKHS